MKKFGLAIASFAMVSAAIPFAAPAIAQGGVGPVKRLTMCPDGYSPQFGVKDGMCYPGKSAPRVYIPQNKGVCASGYRRDGAGYCTDKPASDGVSAADKLVSYGTLNKANRLDRCPLGYFSKADMTTCTTRLSPAPKSRKKSGACNSNEIDEWGLWCTANASAITRAQAEMEADRDFNAIYTSNGARGPAQTPSGDDVYDSAPMVAAYGRKSGGSSASAETSSSDGAAPSTQCQTADGSATGAALGGALGGNTGAALGSMLGGFGKKKKKNNGC